MKKILMILLALVVLFPEATFAEDTAAPELTPVQHQTLVLQMVDWGLSEHDANALVAAMAAARFNTDEMGQIVGQFRLVQKDRQALTAITGKIHEGIAKQVAPKGIMRAVIKVRERHALANTIGQSVTPAHREELSPVVVDALVSGLGERELGQISQGLKMRSQGLGKEQFVHLSLETMMTVRDMMRYGVQSSTATAVTIKALALGYGADEMRVVRQLINDQRMQADVEGFTQRVLQGLNQGVRAGELHGFAARSNNASSSGRGGDGSSGGNGGSGGGHGGSGGGHGGGGR